MSLLAKLEAAARQSVRSFLPPPSPRGPAAAILQQPDMPIAPAAPAPRATSAEAGTRKRATPSDTDHTMRPVKKPRPTVISQKPSAPIRPALVPTVAPLVEAAERRAKMAEKRRDDEPDKRLVLDGASERVRVLEEKKSALHRVPSTTFAPILLAKVQEKHKQVLASTCAAWESLTASASSGPPLPGRAQAQAQAGKKCNYHPAPDWAALHAKEGERQARVLAKVQGTLAGGPKALPVPGRGGRRAASRLFRARTSRSPIKNPSPNGNPKSSGSTEAHQSRERLLSNPSATASMHCVNSESGVVGVRA
ncbi:hypothetical protein CALCODRAFT_480260 [Calocera cornea HHB12733]|uniref:Uncharacterized protein n=1 Tax=Calocera cornea HHB12733 TaxID=1353952 RepID=A0A165IXT4_9BASI|nr:hypothetical protein CALCODRAFT_480260 [Calocera cornea HHB12733]